MQSIYRHIKIIDYTILSFIVNIDNIIINMFINITDYIDILVRDQYIIDNKNLKLFDSR